MKVSAVAGAILLAFALPVSASTVQSFSGKASIGLELVSALDAAGGDASFLIAFETTFDDDFTADLDGDVSYGVVDPVENPIWSFMTVGANLLVGAGGAVIDYDDAISFFTRIAYDGCVVCAPVTVNLGYSVFSEGLAAARILVGGQDVGSGTGVFSLLLDPGETVFASGFAYVRVEETVPAVVATPLPAPAVLLPAALGGLAFLRRRRAGIRASAS